MSEPFSTATIDALARQFREPAWLTELRRAALHRHAELPWPHASDDIWRRTDVSLLDPRRGFSPVRPDLLQSVRLSDAQLAALTTPLGNEQLIARANGAWVTPPPATSPLATLDPAAERRRGAAAVTGGGVTERMPPGITVEELTQAAIATPDPIRAAIESDGMTEAEQKLASLNRAFHHDGLVVRVPPGFAGTVPLRLVRFFSVTGRQAIFPLTLITVGAGSSVTLIDEQISVEQEPARGELPEPPAPHLINGRIELLLEPDAAVHYVRLQRWGSQAREFLLQRATLARGATLTMANINLGAALSKAHVVARLTGEHASTKLYGFVFGRRHQHIDQHTLQDHQAPHTTSDLQFKAALQDHSRMIYTGLIRIAQRAQQTNAYQSNHNLLLSQTARAETIPMLEILADDVQCKHGASAGPIDDEQTFYLMSRGVPREMAQRLIVMGFIEPILQQVPFEPLQERLRREIEGSLLP
ncbi:MAG: Fe-S cluster assembly protein SufD [Candidatus Omnitrophica bacterium]|nr:Fe-S cluster assembly protein SufD [Candidatus Omnitrophota bacterium]